MPLVHFYFYFFSCGNIQTNIAKTEFKLQVGKKTGGCSCLIIATVRILLSGLCHATACFIKSFTPCAGLLQQSSAGMTVVLETSILLGSVLVGSSAALGMLFWQPASHHQA